ncbi:hypothetical protein [Flaviaesturariibacter amylovorans]|uniref:Periplasmic heavy metal sensor n=1 Tax=Flaviaesturariibacter amylovorans TaxID=1084520 RepID=A0ABP8GXP3_9BACT
MKKLLLLVALAVGISSTSLYAQEQRDPAAQAQRMKERIKPALIEKVKLTDEQAEKVIEINMDVRRQMRETRELSGDERKAKAVAIDVDRDKRYKAIPLTDDQVKAVNDFFDALRQQARQNREGGNGGNR